MFRARFRIFTGPRSNVSAVATEGNHDVAHPDDPKAAAAVRFAAKVMQERGHVSDLDVLTVKDAGYTDAQVIEIVLHVALNTLTNYVNSVAQTEIDFPVVTHRAR